MPMYHQLGSVPRKRHTAFRLDDGRLTTEEVFGQEGFDGAESILYHVNSPCRIVKARTHEPVPLREWLPDEHAHRHLALKDFPEGGDPVRARQPMLFNGDVVMSYVRPTGAMDYYYRNGQADELIFIHEGAGTLRTMFGPIEYGEGDYLVVPRGTIYQLIPTDGSAQRHLVIETPGHIRIPKEYVNRQGQLLEHAPYYHRDIRQPAELETFDEAGEFLLAVKVRDGYQVYELDYHPFDVVGWDGYCYPWAFNIHDFEPKAGRLHQPPPAHLTFRGPGFVVCSFMPRMLDWDENAIPIPYHHSNLDSDEVLYYVNGDFSSRRGIDYASVTLHPYGLPHGPQPGLAEKSIGMKSTTEAAVMVDTFRPLKLAEQAREWEDPRYKYSWLHAADPGSGREPATAAR